MFGDTMSAVFQVEVFGAPMDPLIESNLLSVEVDTSMYMPSQCRLVFRDVSTTVIEEGGFQLAVMLTVQVIIDSVPTPIFTGEVTAVEVEYAPEGNLTIVRALDESHRLMHGTKTMSYPEMTASDVVTALIGEAGIVPGEVIPTANVYEWLSQANISSWVFIQQLCALENYVAYVDSMGLFNFCPMPLPEEGMPPVLTYEQPPTGTQLVVGRNLIRLRACVTAAEQVPAVTVLGWNPDEGMPVVGMGPALPSTSQSMDPGTLPAVVAGEMMAQPYFETSRPYTMESAAQSRAEAIAADIAGSLAEVEGQCIGNPSVVAGASISIGMAGLPFDGQYIVTQARHVYQPGQDGYTTWFTVGGRQDRSMFALASGSSAHQSPRPTIPGVVTGTVMDNMDPEEQARVKVMFPWLGPTYVSAWCRTMQIGAGKAGGYGCLFIPEIGDEVLVAFDRGEIDHPYVIGNLYSGLVKPMPAPEVEGVVGSRRVMSRMMHTIQFNDGPEKLGITIQTGTQVLNITMDDEESKISIQTGAGGLAITSLGDVSIESTGSVSIQGVSISVTADSSLSLSGEASTSISGADVSVSGEGSVSVSGPAISLGA